ncbi:MAG: hypothetical protein LUQ04_00920 [Methanoregula sp.]|nr:hypothetical protein [Methanoregula sp.]
MVSIVTIAHCQRIMDEIPGMYSDSSILPEWQQKLIWMLSIPLNGFFE